MNGMNAIPAQILATFRMSICAVGFLTVSPAEYVKDPTKPFFKVCGTGFLVRNTTVITNRHVIEALQNQQVALGFPDSQKFVQFVWRRNADGLQTGFCAFKNVTVLPVPDPDIAFIEIIRRPEPEFKQCQPIAIGDANTLAIGEPISVCGYPYGTSMLARDGHVVRFGPVLQYGYVSALAPYDGIRVLTEILMDIRTAEGMSGAPVFRPMEGTVVGVHRAGWEATTAVAIPITPQQITGWLKVHI